MTTQREADRATVEPAYGLYEGHLTTEQSARVEALHVAREVVKSTGFLSEQAGTADDLIVVAEYITRGAAGAAAFADRNNNADDELVDAEIERL